ncbi:MAG TPA: hypothetical protein DCS93_20245 [Microscillaceae bacterium]|nr:hypothetical protein [Microscillaceae bacterium]
MKSIYILFALSGLILLASCDDEKPTVVVKKKERITVKTTLVKEQQVENIRSYFGKLGFARSTEFFAEQSGTITLLQSTPGQRVIQGQVLAVFPPSNHQLDIDQVNIAYNRLKKDYARQKELYEAGAASKISVETLKTQMEVQAKALQQVKRVNQIVAPFSGMITQVHATNGQVVNPGTPLLSVAQTSQVTVEFYVSPEEIHSLPIGTKAYFMQHHQKILGKISRKSFQMDTRRQGFKVTASFPNSNQKLFVGNTIQLFITAKNRLQLTPIPIHSFRTQGKQHFVFVAKGGKAVKREIIIEKRNEEQAMVSNGLRSGETLIIAGIDKLEDQSPISIIK